MAEKKNRISEKEDALIQRLKTKLPYLRTVMSIDDIDKSLGKKIKIYPAVFVSYKGRIQSDERGVENIQGMGSVKWWDYKFTFYVMAKDFRGEEKSRKGEKGIYRIVDDIYKAFDGQVLGLVSSDEIDIQDDELGGPVEGSPAIVMHFVNLNWLFQEENSEDLL